MLMKMPPSRCAVDSATTVLVGEDTDLPLLMQAQRVMISISILNNAVKRELGEQVSSNILFLHAILGCDTTSHLYGIGTCASLKKSSCK